MIADRIRQTRPQDVPGLVELLKDDGRELDKLELNVNRKLEEEGDAIRKEGIDPFNLLLSKGSSNLQSD